MIDVKADSRAHYSFGVATGHVLNNGEFTATMFDISPGAKEIKISKTSTGFTATLVKVDDVETPLREKGARVFRESDRLGKQDLLNWMVEGLSSMLGKGLSSAAQVFVEKCANNN